MINRLYRICFLVFVLFELLVFVKSDGYYRQIAIFFLAFLIMCLLSRYCTAWYTKLCKWFLFLFIPLLFVPFTLMVLYWDVLGKYNLPDIPTVTSLRMGKVLVIMPHQDDEANCVGGILGDLKECCDVKVVYAFNGNNKIRLREALKSLEHYSIRRESVIFMGYASDWKRENYNLFAPPYKHLYHMEPLELAFDSKGNSSTCGLDDISCYRPGTPYTRCNFKADLYSIINEYRPDTIICVDYDLHPDHRALSLFFDETILQIMKHDTSYKPFVLKSFAYSTSWFASSDFYSANFRSTLQPYACSYMKEVNCYNWNERLRIPVGKRSLTRVLSGNETYESFIEHESQLQGNVGVELALINSDRVFWWRPSGNLLLNAHIEGDGTNLEHLNDVKLYDSADITQLDLMPQVHGWRVEKNGDAIHVHLKKATVLRQMRIYDHISIDNQVKKITVILDNGETIHLGELPSNGVPLIVNLKSEEEISSFVLRVDEASGDMAGLAELEVYGDVPQSPIEVVKVMDHNEDFMFDYMTEIHGVVNFSLYKWPLSSEYKKYKVYLYDEDMEELCLLSADDKGKYQVVVNLGDSRIIVVKNTEDEIVDVARISNPRNEVRVIRQWQQRCDKYFKNYSFSEQKKYYKKLFQYFAQK